MKTLSFLLVVIFVLLSGFTALNWDVISAITPLSLGFATFNMPLGIILLGSLLIVTALFLLFILTLQAQTLLMTRRQNKALHDQQKLADEAELSRFTELRQFLELEFKQQNAQGIDLNQKIITKLDTIGAQTS